MGYIPNFDEKSTSQKNAMALLQELGYEYVSKEQINKERKTKRDVLLFETLRSQLEKINSFEYGGSIKKFSEKSILQAINDLDESLVDGLLKTNEKIYETIVVGRTYPEYASDDVGYRSFSFKFIDFDTTENNVLQYTDEFVVETNEGSIIKLDVVAFVNGIPVVAIECKKRAISEVEAISQMYNYQKNEKAPHFFKFVQILLACNENNAKYATVLSTQKYWHNWHEDTTSVEFDWYNKTLTNTMKKMNRLATEQDKLIMSLLHPIRLFDIFKNFIIYQPRSKIIARYQQYFAVKSIYNYFKRNKNQSNYGSGTIWHTQGSGKSLTMVMLAKYIFQKMKHINPRIVIVTDRVELDDQIHKTFIQSKLRPEKAMTGAHLVDLIGNNGVDIITTIVNKFSTAVNYQKPLKNNNIFIIVDESHRTQYGEFHNQMKRVFPSASYLGFTGTPLMRKDKRTTDKFGNYLHVYTISDGVRDQMIVPLFYESRIVDQVVNQKAIDKGLEMITRNYTKEEVEQVKQIWSKFEKIQSTEMRLGLIACNIYEHFMQFYKGLGQKAMLATSSRFDAIRYQKIFEEYYPELKTRVVISNTIEGNDSDDTKKLVEDYLRELQNNYVSLEDYERDSIHLFKDTNEVDMLIVVNKLLTGFDAPKAAVLYIDKQLKEHSLLQAIARVNRVNEGKSFGLIVDYQGLGIELQSALDIYSGAGLEEFEPEDIKEALINIIDNIAMLDSSYTNLINFFSSIKNKDDIEAYEVYLADETKRQEFYALVSVYSKYVAIALESENIYARLKISEINKHKKALKFYRNLRISVMYRYSDRMDNKEYEAKMRKLLDQHVIAQDITTLFEPTDILSGKDFEKQFGMMKTDRAKADLISTRMNRVISSNMESNPAFYKRFSKMIEETIEEHRDKRISDAEYLKVMTDLRKKLEKGYESVFSFPTRLNNLPNEQAFYGVTKEVLSSKRFNEEDMKEVSVDIALKVGEIFKNHIKVDWRYNDEVLKVIKSNINDHFYYNYSDHIKRGTFTWDDVDNLIIQYLKIAQRVYHS